MKNSKILILGLALIVAFGLGVWWIAKPSATNTNTVANASGTVVVDQCATAAAATANVNGVTTVPSITYAGSPGKDALQLLQASHTVDATAAGFVNAIDGITPGDHQFWLLCVNGKGAEVGAKDLNTNASDRIEWKLGTF